MDNDSRLTNQVVKQAIAALQAGNKQAWYSLFADNAFLTDDGRPKDFKEFSESALGTEYFLSIDEVKNEGLEVYGNFHAGKWGEFKVYFKFAINGDNKIDKLDIGQM